MVSDAQGTRAELSEAYEGDGTHSNILSPVGNRWATREKRSTWQADV